MGFVTELGRVGGATLRAGKALTPEAKFLETVEVARRRASGFSFRSRIEAEESMKLAKAAMERIVASSDELLAKDPLATVLRPIKDTTPHVPDRYALAMAKRLEIGWYSRDVIEQRLIDGAHFLSTREGQAATPAAYEQISRNYLKLAKLFEAACAPE